MTDFTGKTEDQLEAVTALGSSDHVLVGIGGLIKRISLDDALRIFGRGDQALITATGDVVIADDETADEIEINNTSGGAINVYLPSVAVRTKPITITDVGGNANAHNITVLPKVASGETIMTGLSWVIDSNGGGIRLTPNSAQTGYK